MNFKIHKASLQQRLAPNDMPSQSTRRVSTAQSGAQKAGEPLDSFEDRPAYVALVGPSVPIAPPTVKADELFLSVDPSPKVDLNRDTVRPVGPGFGKRTMFSSKDFHFGHWTRRRNLFTGKVHDHPSVKAEVVLKAALEAIAPYSAPSMWNVVENVRSDIAHDHRLNVLYDELERRWSPEQKAHFSANSQDVFDERGLPHYSEEAFDSLIRVDRGFVVAESFSTIASGGGDGARLLNEARMLFGDSMVGEWLIQNRGVAGFVDGVLVPKLAARVENRKHGAATGTEALDLERQAIEEAGREAERAYVEYVRRFKNALTGQGVQKLVSQLARIDHE